MTTRSDGDELVAFRTYEQDDGKVELMVFKPKPYPDPLGIIESDDPPWRCDFTLFFPDGEVRRDYAVGIDSIQALLLAFAGAAHRLRFVGDGTTARRPTIRWLEGDDLGLTINHYD